LANFKKTRQFNLIFRPIIILYQ